MSTHTVTPDYKCQSCGGESDYAAHGVHCGEIYDEYWCTGCYYDKDRNTSSADKQDGAQ